MDLFNHLATNVAARRAHGDLVLATTPDIIIGERLASALRAQVWQDDVFYRAPRHDAALPGLPFGRKISVSALTIIMTAHMIQANEWTGGVPYCKSCGDFILMSHSRWCRLRGYVEWSRCGIWLDGLLLHMAVASGMRQQVFPQPCYHMEHEGRGLSIYKGLPHLPRDTYKRLCAQMLAEHRPIKVNPDTWGLAELRERQVGDDAWVLDAPDVWAPPALRWFE
jgi:hypothetical protein